MTSTIQRDWFSNIRADVLSGIVVALALIPEAIGFSVIAGVDPKVGLYASVVIACVIAFTGGRVAMISAATASTAVLMGGLVREHGVQYLFAATILMGLFQIVAGWLRLGRLMRFVSQSVMTGFVNALAILIFLAQMPELIHVPMATYGLIALGLAIIYLFPRLTTAIPSPLVAIVVVTIISVVFHLDVRTVANLGELPSALPAFGVPQVPLTFETLRVLTPLALTLAAVGLLESLLTAQIVDDMTDTPSPKSRECVGQGVANIASALFGGMGGCAMIGQSVINVSSGGRGRLSTLIAGAFLLVLLVALQKLLAIVPVAALTAVMIMVSINTFSWRSIARLRTNPWPSSVVMLATVLTVVATADLANGVLPELEPIQADLREYDTIFLGSPNWCHTLAAPVEAFSNRSSSLELSGSLNPVAWRVPQPTRERSTCRWSGPCWAAAGPAPTSPPSATTAATGANLSQRRICLPSRRGPAATGSATGGGRPGRRRGSRPAAGRGP